MTKQSAGKALLNEFISVKEKIHLVASYEIHAAYLHLVKSHIALVHIDQKDIINFFNCLQIHRESFNDGQKTLRDLFLVSFGIPSEVLVGWISGKKNLPSEKMFRLYLEEILLIAEDAVKDLSQKIASTPVQDLRPLDLIELLESDPADLELSVRTANCLKNDKVKLRTVRDVVLRSEAEYMRTPNFGRKSLNELREVIQKASRGQLKIGMTDEQLSKLGV